MVIKIFEFKQKIKNSMSKKALNNGQDNSLQRKNKTSKEDEKKQPSVPMTPSKKQSEDMNDQFFNLMSPFALPPKFSIQFTAASQGNFGFSTDLRVIQTPYQHQPFSLHPAGFEEEINSQLRPITGRIDFDNTPEKNNHISSDEEQSSQSSQSSESPRQDNQVKEQIQQKVIDEQSQNPEKPVRIRIQKNVQSRIIEQRHLTKRMSHQKKLLEQLIAPEINSSGKKVYCNCKKTKCIKLYCDCFRINQTCDGCNCQGCHNLQQYADERNNAIMALMDRNPDPFSLKIHQDKHLKGCNCKKSYCLKKYCECYQANLKCGENCKCDECKNGGGSEQRERDRLEREGVMEEEDDEEKKEKKDIM